MVKKQTVWLLTMLSLLIVLSVYYMTSPDNGEMAFIQEEEWAEMTENAEKASGENDTVISQVSTDELFAAIRLDQENKRDQMKEQLNQVISSSDFSTAEKNEALEKIETLEDRKSKEKILENTILAGDTYEDVLVRAEDELVTVTVKANELTRTETNQIIQMVSDEFGEIEVRVQFQPQSE